jgi:L-fuculose-phosphate aldolase
MNFEMLHPADQIVMIMERVYGYGMTTTSGGNISILDENGDIWITPGGIDKGSLTRKDIIQVKPDGTIIGNHKPSVEFPFHELLYKKRPDVRAVLHAHPPALVAFSIVRKIPQIRLIPNANIVCGDVGMAPYALPGSVELGEKIAAVFEKGYNTVILENHGVVVAGENLYKSFMAFETLDFCARLEINACRIGTTVVLSQKDIDLTKKKNLLHIEDFEPKGYSSSEREARHEMCSLIHRAYDQRLFTSTQGTFSQRLEVDSFIITPYGLDRKYIEPVDLVRIDNGRKEAGKHPSRSVMLHKYIYEAHPHINSVIIAHPPNIMSFAVTKELFESKTIPESYILLRDVHRMPFGMSFMEQRLVAEKFAINVPVIIAENDCVIVTGSSLLNAFDRLEVLEYSAKAVIASKELGDVVSINTQSIREIDIAFNL